MREIGAQKERGIGSETEQVCHLLGKENEKESGRENEEEVVEVELEWEQEEEVEGRIWGVFRC